MAAGRRRAPARDLRGGGRAGHDRAGHADGTEGCAHRGGGRVHAGGPDPPDARHRPRAEHPVRARATRRSSSTTRCTRSPTARSTCHPGSPAPSGSMACRRRSPTWATPRPTPRSWSSPGADRAIRSRPMTDTFPRQYARTQRFTLGEPRNVTVSPDARRAVFLRSRAGDDPVNCLWTHDIVDGHRGARRRSGRAAVADGRGRATTTCRPRRRPGVNACARAPAASRRSPPIGPCRSATFTLAGRLFVAGLVSAAARELPVDGPVFDPHPDPLAQRLAYVSGSRLRIAELDGSTWELAGDADRRRHVGQRRLRRRRGDGPVPRLLVEPRWHRDRRLSGRQRPRAALAHRRSGRPAYAAHRAALPGCRHAEPRRHVARAGTRRRQRRGGVGPRRVPVPGHREVARSRAPAAVGAVARSAHPGGARGQRRSPATPLRCSPTPIRAGSIWCRAARR